MADAALEILQNMAAIRLPGALSDGVNLELAATLREFCDRTNAWTEDVTVHAVAGRTEYILSAEATIQRLICVVNSTDLPVGADLTMPDTLVLRNEPSQVDTLTATVSLAPVPMRPLVVPTWFFTTYKLGLLDGVLGRMMAQPAKPWSNPTLSVFHQRKFNVVIANASAAVRHGHGYGRQAWRFPKF